MVYDMKKAAAISPLAGKPAPKSLVVDLARLEREYYERKGESREVTWSLVRLAWSSVAALAMAPLQDILNLGAEARMNTPGRAEGNWAWRCTENMLSNSTLHPLLELTRSSNRL